MTTKKKESEKIATPEFFPRRIKLQSVFKDESEPTRIFNAKEDSEITAEINRLKSLYKSSAIEFKLTYGAIKYITKYPNGMFFKNTPSDSDFIHKGEGFESFYMANKDYSKVVRLIEM